MECEIHKVLVGIGKLCPLCELEKKNKIKYKDEAISDEDIFLKEKDRDRKRKDMLDPEKKKRHYNSVAKYYARDRQRKKEHSLRTI